MSAKWKAFLAQRWGGITEVGKVEVSRDTCSTVPASATSWSVTPRPGRYGLALTITTTGMKLVSRWRRDLRVTLEYMYIPNVSRNSCTTRRFASSTRSSKSNTFMTTHLLQRRQYTSCKQAKISAMRCIRETSQRPQLASLQFTRHRPDSSLQDLGLEQSHVSSLVPPLRQGGTERCQPGPGEHREGVV